MNTRCLDCYKKKCDPERCTHICHKWDKAVTENDISPEGQRQQEEESTRDFLGL